MKVEKTNLFGRNSIGQQGTRWALTKSPQRALYLARLWSEFTAKPELPETITVTVFKVEGETNTDDLSPATHATTRPDIPLHATAMLETRMPGGLEELQSLKAKGHPVAYVGDVVGTGS